MSPTPNEDVRPHLVRDALRRYWALILLCAVALGAAAGAFVHTRSASYVASATVLLQPTLGNPFSPNTSTSATQVTIAIQTESTLVDSAPVAALSNKSLGPANQWTPGSGTVTATVPPNTQNVTISFKASSASRAQAGAQAVATSFLNYRRAQSVAAINAGSAVLNSHIAALNKRLAAAQRQAQRSTSPATTATANQQIQAMTGQLVSLQDSLTQLQSGDTNPGSVISPAKLPSKAAGISTPIYIGAGAVLGLLAGFVLAMALTRRDKRVRRSAAAVHDIPVLGVLSGGSVLGRASERSQRGLRVAYQRLRLGILGARPRGSAIALSGLSERDTVSDVAAELASSFTRAAYRVVLVVAETDTVPSTAVELAGRPGLSDVLVGQNDWREVLLERDGVEVLPPGRNLDDVQERLSSDRFRTLLAELAASCDYVFVVAPPMTTPAGVAVARAARATLLVGREMRTTSVDVDAAAGQAELVGARVIGLVLRLGRVSPRSARRRRTSPPRPAPVERAARSRHSANRDAAAGFPRPAEDQSSADIGMTERSDPKVDSSSGQVKTPAGQDQAGGRP